jgi:uncharacterized protein YjbJ (UPF0337 family)
MNKDQVKGSVKAAAGKVQSKVGDMVGNTDQQAKGMVKEVAGNAQKKMGDAKEVMADAHKKM